MEIEIVGPWLLLGIGVFLLFAGAVASMFGKGPRWPWIWIFGLGAAGIGAYGPAFMKPYGDWLKVVSPMIKNPSAETYAGAFERIGRGDVPPEVQELALGYALNRPVEGMDGALSEAIEKATDPGAKGALEQTRAFVEQRVQHAENMGRDLARLAKEKPDEGRVMAERTLKSLDPVTRIELGRKLSDWQEPELERLKLTRDDAAELRRLRAPLVRPIHR